MAIFCFALRSDSSKSCGQAKTCVKLIRRGAIIKESRPDKTRVHPQSFPLQGQLEPSLALQAHGPDDHAPSRSEGVSSLRWPRDRALGETGDGSASDGTLGKKDSIL